MRRHARASSTGSTSGRANRPRSIRIGALLALASLLLAASAAFALETHPHKGTISGSATPNGAFGALSGLAVDQSGGDLYVTDFSGAGAPVEGTGAVHRFDSTGAYEATIDGQGTPQGELSLSDPTDVAVDNSTTGSDGTVYVADINHNLVDAFDESGAYLSQLDGSSTPAGAFSFPCAVAVDASGNLLVGDFGNNRIWIFDSSGAYLGRVADSKLESPCGLALDSTGELYVRNYNGGKVLKFHRLGAAEYDLAQVFFDPSNGTPDDASDDRPAATDVAVDTSTDRVLVDAGSQAFELNASGSQVSSFGQGKLSSSKGIAVDPSSGRIYASDGASLHLFGPLATLPDVATGEASNVQKDSATISGTIDPAGGPDAECEFEWGTDTSYGQTAACIPAGPFSGFAEVSAQLSGLSAGLTYHFRIVGSNANGSNAGADRTFATTAAPSFSGEERVFASVVHSTTATVNAKISPQGANTSFHVEYGLEDCSLSACASVPAVDTDIGSGDALDVSQQLSGLTPNTTYHYRFVATNSGGTIASKDRTFHTFALATPTGLPDGRAYEMVSPTNKNGSDVVAMSWRSRSAADGNAITFLSTASFANAEGASSANEYIAKRGSEGWVTHPLTPNTPPGNDALPAQGRQFIYMGEFSDDLNEGVALTPTPLTDDPKVAHAYNLYLRTNILADVGPNPNAGAEYTLLSSSEEVQNDPELFVFPLQGRTQFADHTPDFGHIVFESRNNLTAEAAGLSTAEPKTYEWDKGIVRLVGILPDSACGTPPCPAPLSLAGAGGGTRGSSDGYGPFPMPHIVSEDGSTIFFTTGPLGEDPWDPGGTLYARVDHSTTIQINVSERTDCADHDPCSGTPEPDPHGPQPAHFRGASADGSRVFFVSHEALTDDPEIPANPGLFAAPQLYMYDFNAPVDNRLTVVSQDSLPGENVFCNSADCDHTVGLLGISGDGTFIYFSDKSRLLSDAPDDARPDESSIYVWHNEVVKYVGQMTTSDFAETATPGYTTGAQRLDSRVSTMGDTLVFTTAASNAEFPNVPLNKTCKEDGCDQVYVYQYGTAELKCASCGMAGATPSGDAHIQQFAEAPRYTLGGLTRHLSQALSDDGKRVFFTTKSPLLATDTNGRLDAYEYDVAADRVHLLSTGQCNCDSYFVDASGDGSNVFITTREQLVGIDRDNNADLYDVRVGGGIAAQNPPESTECQGDACQAPASSPNDPTPASATFEGPGNPRVKAKKPTKRHKKRQHKRRAHHRPSATRSHG